MSVPPLTPLAAAVLAVGSPESVLQIQCGDGEGTLFLAREFPRARVRGVDASEELIRAATARVGLDPEGRLAFKVGKPRGLPFPEDHFDLVAAIDAAPAVGETARVLRSGGHLIIARSEPLRSASGIAAKLGRRRLRRHGFELVASDNAGAGSFSVALLR
ncbi:MAG TPA: class I SAM-dependent methyltransferase [Solirubrobacterales bacterium]|jgi:ubiquinone/menaquinone biosynthesis C-methylase UbiE|nr:class I SAM-dependent methyltransferase [Solirubrobacterales bacterium]